MPPFQPYTEPTPRDLKKWSKKGAITYLGLFINETDKETLIAFCQDNNITLHDNIKAHHVTIKFKPSQLVLHNCEPLLGEQFTIKVTGYGQDENVSALRVKMIKMQSDNVTPHVTMSVSNLEGASAKMSNDLDYEDIDGPEITGTLAFFGRGKEYTHIPWK